MKQANKIIIQIPISNKYKTITEIQMKLFQMKNNKIMEKKENFNITKITIKRLVNSLKMQKLILLYK